ncbi:MULTISPECIES: TPM domain-containing protein [unclassified Luteimonas]|uniref:TPM domain-containing protein n=1 Tax=unclassified Luteimonas TaxID=2629088 RepID=UPI001601005D|nr:MULTISPECIES: TPM domain-containing protein [unclassified Luteimonas]MBB1472927.1 TPM domain-containing protein [Luteimonas sp. MC1782]MBB6598372.1 TPM domain-containing protein [Luteimonas sp. MC1825]QOC89433.1 TPM domain-containing protein [Luteimonas sp. MC1825]
MRLLRHLFAPTAHGVFPADSLQRIAEAVAEGERRHRGEVCFAVEPALPALRVVQGVTARARASEVFAELRVWDTQANNGVLVYLLLADHRIEIVADRGLDGLVTDGQWREACARMEERLRAGEHEAAALAGVGAVSGLLARHFPRVAGDIDENELPDLPRLL